jgi:hypothetical protein
MPTVNVPGVGQLNFPDGMSDADMAAAIQKNFPQARSTQPSDSTRALSILAKSVSGLPPMQFGAGIAEPGIRTGLGLEQLTGDDLSDDDKALLNSLSSNQSSSATAGRVLGNVALLAAPGGAVGELASALPRTMAMRGLTIAGTDAAANAGTAALAVPEPGRTRAGDAAIGALGSLGGSAVTGAVKGVPSAAFQDFMDFADKVTNLGSLASWGIASAALHQVAPKAALAMESGVSVLKGLSIAGKNEAVKTLATGETAAQKYLQNALPSTINYLSQVGAGAAEGMTE